MSDSNFEDKTLILLGKIGIQTHSIVISVQEKKPNEIIIAATEIIDLMRDHLQEFKKS